MPSVKVGAWRLVIIPGDHEPRHVHARRGTRDAPTAIIYLRRDGGVTLREADRRLSRAEISEALDLVHDHFDALAALWKEYHR